MADRFSSARLAELFDMPAFGEVGVASVTSASVGATILEADAVDVWWLRHRRSEDDLPSPRSLQHDTITSDDGTGLIFPDDAPNLFRLVIERLNAQHLVPEIHDLTQLTAVALRRYGLRRGKYGNQESIVEPVATFVVVRSLNDVIEGVETQPHVSGDFLFPTSTALIPTQRRGSERERRLVMSTEPLGSPHRAVTGVVRAAAGDIYMELHASSNGEPAEQLIPIRSLY